MTKRRFKTPGVFVKEISFPAPLITGVDSSVVAFIGYTERATHDGNNLHLIPTKIRSFFEFEIIYGKAFPSKFEIVDSSSGETESIIISGQAKSVTFLPNQQSFLYASVKAFFNNGGSSCYIISVGNYASQSNISIEKSQLIAGITALEDEVEPSIVAIPDAVLLETESYEVYREMLTHCAEAGNRFAILDVPFGYRERSISLDCITEFRNNIGDQHLSFGAAYYPWLHSSLIPENQVATPHCFEEISLEDILPEMHAQTFLNSSPKPSGDYLHQGLLSFSPTYSKLIEAVIRKSSLLPPSGFIAGVYAATEQSRGVWKAPSNVRLNSVSQVSISISDKDQRDLNVDTISGKSINTIRLFPRKGILIWGARTLAGNDNEWRYISVKRTCMMVEQSIRNGIKPLVFEENNAALWGEIKVSCTNFLSNIWRQRGLAGSRPNHAFYVKVGLGETMSALDISEKRLIVEIGMAVVRPAEFIVIRIQQKMA